MSIAQTLTTFSYSMKKYRRLTKFLLLLSGYQLNVNVQKLVLTLLHPLTLNLCEFCKIMEKLLRMKCYTIYLPLVLLPDSGVIKENNILSHNTPHVDGILYSFHSCWVLCGAY